MVPITIRAKSPDDMPFVFSSWLKSYRNSPAVNHVSNDIYYWNHHKLLEGLWADDKLVWLLATNQDDTTHVYGWVCGQLTSVGPIIHYVYVRQHFRRLGIASRLIKALAGYVDSEPPEGTLYTYTHQTNLARTLTTGRAGWVYNPYAIYYQLPSHWHADTETA